MSAPKSDHEPDVWDGLAQGELSREEEAVLRALAEEGEEAAVHYEAFAPLDEDFRARTTAKLEAQIQASQHAHQRRRFAGASFVVLAAAAAVLLFVVPRDSKLAPYALEARGGMAEVRGSASQQGPLTYDAQSKLTLVARPPAAVTGSVVASLALIVDGRAKSVPAQVTIAETGAVRVEVLGKDLPLQGKHIALSLVVERKAQSPQEILRLQGEHDPRVLSTTLVPKATPQP